MIAPRLLKRSEWQKLLHTHGCRPSFQMQAVALKSAEWWETEHGRLFTVPMDNSEGMLREDDLREVLAQVTRLKPLNLF